MSGDAIRIDAPGLPRLIASLKALEGDLAEIAPPDAATVIGGAAQQRAPKRSGALAASLFSSTASGKVTVGFGARHAGPLNFGVGPRSGMRGPHNIAATRFLTGAVADKESVWINSYTDAIETAIGKVQAG